MPASLQDENGVRFTGYETLWNGIAKLYETLGVTVSEIGLVPDSLWVSVSQDARITGYETLWQSIGTLKGSLDSLLVPLTIAALENNSLYLGGAK